MLTERPSTPRVKTSQWREGMPIHIQIRKIQRNKYKHKET